MKKQTLIVIILCVLVAVVIALSASGAICPQDRDTASLASFSKTVPTVTPVNTDPSGGTNWDNSEPTTP